ncbi:hypothetical protein [Cereibacter johrii]|uniref:hypothetical protein n=1 Tax=Cereibacter johrii TaxID=445629 RepID=UPI000DCE5EE8|nr:hypothetical protein [Cereibacter johrii]RAZ82900.1 hypothetical protein DDV93_17700 [Cereibacter johrii]
MGKGKKEKSGKKGSQLVIRVDKGERDAFVALCNSLDTSAARELRRFMRAFVASHNADAAPAAEPASPAPEVPAADDTSSTPAQEASPAPEAADTAAGKAKDATPQDGAA